MSSPTDLSTGVYAGVEESPKAVREAPAARPSLDPGARRVQELPEVLANQIAAGEVIERPASVVKELLENCVDAEARQISVHVEGAGSQLIEVRDDGMGIHRDDLLLAFRRHATSKIASLSELEAVRSMGFRGEALPSIASVSRVRLTSLAMGAAGSARPETARPETARSETGEMAHCLVLEGGEPRGEPAPVAHPPGTTIEIRDLFFNTPARRRFLRTAQTEWRHLEGVFQRMALARLDLGWTLVRDGREVHRYPPGATESGWASRVTKVWGARFMSGALRIELESEGAKLWGWVASPEVARPQSDHQHLFVNRRPVRDPLLRHAVKQAYESLLAAGMQPAYVLHLELEPTRVDVNVHPSKQNLRFHEARLLHDFVSRGLRRVLLRSASLPGIALEPSDISQEVAPASSADHELRAGEGVAGYEGGGALSPQNLGQNWGQNWGQNLGQNSGSPPHRASSHGSSASLGTFAAVYGASEAARDDGAATVVRCDPYLLVSRRDGVLLVDLPQAEAALALSDYEACVSVVTRPLLVPVGREVAPAVADWVEQVQPALIGLGFELQRMSVDRVSLRQVPAELGGFAPDELLGCLLGLRECDPGAELDRRGVVDLIRGSGVSLSYARARPQLTGLIQRIDAGRSALTELGVCRALDAGVLARLLGGTGAPGSG